MKGKYNAINLILIIHENMPMNRYGTWAGEFL